MTVNKKQDGTSLTIAPVGRLDANTSREFAEVMENSLTGIEHLTIDFGQLEYISSAGLRILLMAQKTMDRQGDMKLTHVSETILEILEPTGLLAILTIE